MIYVFALSSIAVYGVILGGWASNNKYSFLGGLRSSAQLIAYEIAAGPGHSGRGAGQPARCGWTTIIADAGRSGRVESPSCSRWASSCSSSPRLPKRPGCRSTCRKREQELIGGYHTEYAGMKLLLFLIAEFLHMITASFLIVILFLGGWHFWGLTGGPTTIDQLAARRIAADRRAAGQDLAGDPVLHAGPLELAAVPLRSAHDPGLEGDAAAGAGEPGGAWRFCTKLRHVHDRAADRAWPGRLVVIAGSWAGVHRAPGSATALVESARDRQPPAAAIFVTTLERGFADRMKPDDPNIKWIEEPQLGLAGKMYLPLFVQGLTTTVKHLARSLRGEVVTVSYPDEEPKIGNPLIYRGVHRLNKDDAGPREVRGLLSVRHGLPGALHRHRRRREPLARSRKVSGELHDRRAALHLLRHVRRSLPGRCHRADEPVRPDRPQPRGDDLRQGEAAQRLRHDEGRRADEVAGAGRDGHMTPSLLAALPTGKRRAALPDVLGACCLARSACGCCCPRGCRFGKALGGVLVAVAGGLFAYDLPRLGDVGRSGRVLDAGRRDGRRGGGHDRVASPVYSAIWFALSLLGTAGLFLFQGAQFLGVATIVVYAGAILVTFLFVIMLAQPEGHASYDRLSWGGLPKVLGVVTAALLVGILTFMLGRLKDEAVKPLASPKPMRNRRRRNARRPATASSADKHVANLGPPAVQRAPDRVEVAGTLLLVALVGAVAIAHAGPAAAGRADRGGPAMNEISLLYNYLVVGGVLFALGPGRLSRPAEHDRHVPLRRDDAARRLAQPRRLGAAITAQRLGRPDAGDLHPHRRGLRGGDRAGPGPDARPADAASSISPPGRTCARKASRPYRRSRRCPKSATEDRVWPQLTPAGIEPPTTMPDVPSCIGRACKRRPMDDTIRNCLILIPALPLAAAVLVAVLGPRVLRGYSHWPVVLALRRLVRVQPGAAARSRAGARAAQSRRRLRAGRDALDLGRCGRCLRPEAESARRAAEPTPAGAIFRIDVALRADALTAIMLAMVTFVSSLVAIYAIGLHARRPRLLAVLRLHRRCSSSR